ncbi:MAG: 6-carboxytetrahydropterin synthase [Bacteroidota bacterium]|nr:6-carboxytetrahydropterin synthase [Bacteroidota bacterium]
MVYITRREIFNAAHRLFMEEWSDQQNLEVFGKCSNPLWHGHNYILYITIKGELDPQTGYLMDLRILSSIINDKIISKVDHKNINLEVEFMKGKIPSAENFAINIWNELNAELLKHNCALHCVKLCETENNYVEYFGK